MRKVVYLINSLKKGGPVNMLYTLIKYLDNTEFEVTVIALKECLEENKTDFSKLSCNIITLNNKNLRQKIQDVQLIINKIQPHIVHSHGGIADLVNSQLKKSYKSFSTIHCDPDEDFIMKKGRIIGYLRATFFLYTLKKFDYPVACSKTVANNIKKKRNMDFKYIRNGIDVENISYIKNGSTREAYGINTDDVVLVFCGYLSKRKNVSYILKAFENIKRKDVKLIVLGDGVEYASLKESRCEDNRIIFLGKVNNPYEFLNLADYFISASLSEGLPLAVMEGMSSGLPAILSKIDSHMELKECSQNGIELFSLSNIDDLIEKIEKIKKPDKYKIKAAQDTIIGYFNASRMASEYEKLYKI